MCVCFQNTHLVVMDQLLVVPDLDQCSLSQSISMCEEQVQAISCMSVAKIMTNVLFTYLNYRLGC